MTQSRVGQAGDDEQEREQHQKEQELDENYFWERKSIFIPVFQTVLLCPTPEMHNSRFPSLLFAGGVCSGSSVQHILADGSGQVHLWVSVEGHICALGGKAI